MAKELRSKIDILAELSAKEAKKEQESKEKHNVRCAKIEGRVYLDVDDLFLWLTNIQLNPRANKHTKQELGRVKNGLLAFRASAKELPEVPFLNKPADQNP